MILETSRFPRASRYNPEWLIANASGGANSLWLTEWLIEALNLHPNMKVLDLGCGRGLSSVFLRRECGVQVWAADLWFSPSENLERIRDAGVEDGVFPMRVEARSLPFATEFFDVILSIDSFFYYGTDDLYLNYVARFLKPNGYLAIAGAGLTRELDGVVPKHLHDWWSQDLWCIHSAEWWRRHWERTGIVEVELADNLKDGWQFWLDWQRAVCPENHTEIAAVEADQGRSLGYVRCIARRRSDVKLQDPIESIPAKYKSHPLLRTDK